MDQQPEVEFLEDDLVRFNGTVMQAWRAALVVSVLNPERYEEIVRSANAEVVVNEYQRKKHLLALLSEGVEIVPPEHIDGLTKMVERFFAVCADEAAKRGMLVTDAVATMH